MTRVFQIIPNTFRATNIPLAAVNAHNHSVINACINSFIVHLLHKYHTKADPTFEFRPLERLFFVLAIPQVESYTPFDRYLCLYNRLYAIFHQALLVSGSVRDSLKPKGRSPKLKSISLNISSS